MKIIWCTYRLFIISYLKICAKLTATDVGIILDKLRVSYVSLTVKTFVEIRNSPSLFTKLQRTK